MQAARVMSQGYGWVPALEVMRAFHGGDLAEALERVDGRHAALHAERLEARRALEALRLVSGAAPVPMPGGRGRPAGLRVGEAARLVGVKVSTLRFWEAQGLLTPARDAENGYRLYKAHQARRLQVVALLRKAGYGSEAILAVLERLEAGRPDEALRAAERRLEELAEASRRCGAATAAFWSYACDLEPV